MTISPTYKSPRTVKTLSGVHSERILTFYWWRRINDDVQPLYSYLRRPRAHGIPFAVRPEHDQTLASSRSLVKVWSQACIETPMTNSYSFRLRRYLALVLLAELLSDGTSVVSPEAFPHVQLHARLSHNLRIRIKRHAPSLFCTQTSPSGGLDTVQEAPRYDPSSTRTEGDPA